MENSRCQSLGLVLTAAAYDALGAADRGVLAAFAGFGVATRVPSGV